jgi:hypothetical protein
VSATTTAAVPLVDRARAILAAASLPLLEEPFADDAEGLTVRPHGDGSTVLVATVVGGRIGGGYGTAYPVGADMRCGALSRQALDAITAEGWERREYRFEGGVFAPPAGPLHPLVKETIAVLERHGQPGYSRFAVSLLESGNVRVDVVGGWDCRELSLNDVASPALYAAGFTVERKPEGQTGWFGVEHLEVRPPAERREEWALCHTVRRFLQSEFTNVGWDVAFEPAQESHMPDGAAPGSHLGALLFQFSGHAIHSPYSFDFALRRAGYAIEPGRFRWRRILRPLPAGESPAALS